MNKFFLSVSAAIFSSGLLATNAFSCEKNITVGDWRGFSNIYPLPTSQVVCIDSGFNYPIEEAVIDYNFSEDKGIYTIWFGNGTVRVASNYSINQSTSNTLILITDSELDFRVGNKEFKIPINLDKSSYQLTPELLGVLADAYRKNIKVQMRFLPTGIVNFIGDDTVIALGQLYYSSSKFGPVNKRAQFLQRSGVYGH